MKPSKQSDQNETETSKFLSFVLRHQPEAIGLELDSEGWADISELLRQAAAQGRHISHEHLLRVVKNNAKKRFVISDDGQRIRAAQGHSTNQVDIGFAAQNPPEVLFHGTAQRFLDSILRQGLLPGQRQYVHLSADAATAEAVGKRHGKPVVLRVDTAAMAQSGFAFYLSENGVWLARAVPPKYLRKMSE